LFQKRANNVNEREQTVYLYIKRLCVQLKGENGMKKTIMTLSMAASVGLGTLFAGMPADKVFAESVAELEAKQQEIQSKSSGIENEINEKTDQI